MMDSVVGAQHAAPLQSTPVVTRQRIFTALAFLFLLIVAAALRLLIFDHYLPYIEDGNEQNMFLLTLHWRGVGADIYGYNIQYVVDWLHGYPPLYLWLNALTQQVTEALAPGQWLFAPDYFYTARLLAALFSIVTTALVVSIGWQVGGAASGWFAGLIWALSPIVLLEDSAAVPDPFVFFTAALSITLALRAWRLRNPLWLFGSFLAGLLTILFKYSHVYVFIPFVIVTLIFLREKPKRTLAWIALEIAIGLIAAAYLVVGYGALGVSNREADQFQQRGLESLLSLDRNLNNARMALLTFTQSPILALLTVAVVGGGIAARWRGERVLDWRRVGVLALFSVTGIVVTSGFSRVFEGNIRYMLPVTMALAVLWGAGISQILWSFGRGTANFVRYRAPTIALLTALVSAALLPASISMIQQYQLTPTPLLLREYMRYIPNDGVILMPENSDLRATWDRSYSGYDGPTFGWAFDSRPWLKTPPEFAAQGVEYLAISNTDYALFDTDTRPQLEAFIAQLTPLKSISTTPQTTGPAVDFYRMLPPQVEADVVFGVEGGDQIRLAGYDLSADEILAGDTLMFRPYWRVDAAPHENYSMFVHLWPADGLDVLAQFDGPPAHSDPASPPRLTPAWDDPAELIVGNQAQIVIPPDLTAGDYRLAVGLYNFATGQRLMTNGIDRYEIPITVG